MPSIHPGLTHATRAAAASAATAAAAPRLPAAAAGSLRSQLGQVPAGAAHTPQRRLTTSAGLPPTPAVRAVQTELRAALQAIALPPGHAPLSAEQLGAASERLKHAEDGFARAIDQPSAKRSAADVLALNDLRGVLRAVNDCWPAFEHLALKGQPITPGQLLADLNLEPHELVQIAGHPHAPADAVAMLNLSGVSTPVSHEARGHWASRLFVLINAQSRLAEPALDHALAGMRAGHEQGLDLLPALGAGSIVRRGMSVDDGMLRLMAGRFDAAARSGEVMPWKGLFTGSKVGDTGGSGAYPGNVQLRVTAADGSAFKDSSAFNYVPEQHEAKGRALSFAVREAQLLPPGQRLPPSFALDAHVSASSGRSQQDFAAGPVLVVNLQEVVRPRAAERADDSKKP